MGPQDRKDTDKLEQLSRGSPRCLGLEHLPCEERLQELGLFNLEKRWLESGLTAAPNT